MIEVRTEEALYILGLPFEYVFGFAAGAASAYLLRWLSSRKA